ncbi:hypothetical protein OIV19_21560 [Brucella sp. HL-2]|nr:hypothetical protein [Brucella sp. HL-2]MCV9910186.1 hypothetical protein [Brucella sp. HL-2]
MRFVELDDLVKRVRTFAAACPLPLAERNIIEKARALCSIAAVWRDTDEATFTKADPCEYVCTIQSAAIVQIEKARFEGRALKPVTPDWLDANYPDWDDPKAPQSDGPAYYAQLQPNTVQVFPRGAGRLWMRLQLKPALEADVLPADLVEHYGELLALGAAGQVLMTPNLDFANPQLGSAMLQKFETDLAKAKVQATRTQVGARLRTTPQLF